MHSVEFIQDLTIVLLVAGLVTILFRRLKQPVVLGYILAGVIIGPHTPPFSFIHNEQIIQTLAQLGVIFLMFSLGLHFSFRQLKAVGFTALVAGTLEIIFMLLIGFELGRFFGWSRMDSIFLGAILSISSTTIIVKVLEDLKLIEEKSSKLIFGILIIEDILAIAILALLSGSAQTGSLQMMDVLGTLGRLGLFLAVSLVLGLIAVPVLLRYVGRFRSREMLLITVLGLCFGVSLFAIKLGYSEALGAFLIGAVIAETEEHHEIEKLVEPLRDMFSAIFFVSVGLLIQPKYLLEFAGPILIIAAAVVLGKILTCSLGTLVAGNDVRTSLRVGMGLAQIGEFSFIIAGLGLQLGVTSSFLYPIVVTVSAITTLLTPYLIRSSDAVARALEKKSPHGFTTWIDLYVDWMKKMSSPRDRSVIVKQIRRSAAIIILNVILISAIFVGADYAADHLTGWWAEMPAVSKYLPPISWFVAMVASLPFLVATLRKLHAVGMMLAEISVGGEDPSSRGLKIARGVISNTIVVMGAAMLGIWIIYIGSTFFPPRLALLGMGVIILLILILFWQRIIRFYSKFQISLEEAWKKSPH